ncbi:putative chitin synthase activator (Chs3) [Aspergillus glaucus CBS 516.65]|uniref:HCP-like protein n=1 Tax=Aspergillus glaucus CBS 516.65 TaxID=1160497 RepID=A0A1L9VL59_ASPGL|nr:hypothetical protein ASPGLDRAFT_35141 [Aspergillus glaucus CBS 516.65]OJJ84656.1 hypothetical protein ASPGLDRAFT_35141 [Aspergillus glaucus CBS 516.65]
MEYVERPRSCYIPRKPIPWNAQLEDAPHRNSFASSSGSWSVVSDSLDSIALGDSFSSGSERARHSPKDYRAFSFSRLSTASPGFQVSWLEGYSQSSPAVNPGNAHLRPSDGDKASLFRKKQTFDMYLANVKKTDNANVQYEFALFLLDSIQNRSTESTEMTPDHLRKAAKSILRRLSDRSHPHAQYYLGDGYASGLFSKGAEDYDRAFPLFVAASKHGHVEACYRAALCYELGWGTRVEAARAAQFYRQAASKNHPGAMLRMAQACLTGDMGLGRKRYREGIKWMKRASESSDMQYNSAPYELGLLHESGYGNDVFPDASYAAQLFTRSAELGHAEASYRLGDAYEHGKLHCPRDPQLSIHYYTCAAEQGHPLAMMAICAWYLVGAEPILEQDANEAYEWAKQAADLELPKAQYAVAFFTETGLGCERDPFEASAWYVRAADQGDIRAKQRISTIRAAGGFDVDEGPSKGKKRTDEHRPKWLGIF